MQKTLQNIGSFAKISSHLAVYYADYNNVGEDEPLWKNQYILQNVVAIYSDYLGIREALYVSTAKQKPHKTWDSSAK